MNDDSSLKSISLRLFRRLMFDEVSDASPLLVVISVKPGIETFVRWSVDSNVVTVPDRESVKGRMSELEFSVPAAAAGAAGFSAASKLSKNASISSTFCGTDPLPWANWKINCKFKITFPRYCTLLKRNSRGF